MRPLTVILLVLMVALQWPLWFGKGGWLRVWDITQQLEAQKKVNQQLAARNAALDAEVRDLKTGYAAIEERARTELNMVKSDELFFQVVDGQALAKAAANPRPDSGPAPLPPRDPASKEQKAE